MLVLLNIGRPFHFGFSFLVNFAPSFSPLGFPPSWPKQSSLGFLMLVAPRLLSIQIPIPIYSSFLSFSFIDHHFPFQHCVSPNPCSCSDTKLYAPRLWGSLNAQKNAVRSKKLRYKDTISDII